MQTRNCPYHYWRNAAHRLHHASACDRSGVLGTQEPRPLSVVQAPVRAGRCLLPRSGKPSLHGGPAAEHRPGRAGTPEARYIQGRRLAGAVCQRPSLCGVVAPERGDCQGVRQRTRGQQPGTAGFGGKGHSPGSPGSRRAFPGRSRPRWQAVRAPRLCRRD